MPDTPHHVGHRERLRNRFLQGGEAALADYELLELILFMAQPRRDMKPLAKALIARFGSFAEVISADARDLTQVEGVGDAILASLKAVQAGAVRLTREEIIERPVLSNWQSLLDHCRAAMAYDKEEHFRVLFLNAKNVLIADEVQQRGTVDHTPVYPREVIKRALELGASAIIMVHNHPSGDAKPSQGDIDMTREIQDAGAKLGVTLHDHVIVARGGYTSLKSQGFL